MHTIESLCARYGVDMTHAQHVARIATRLFDETCSRGFHQLSPRDRDLLASGALLHDVARRIDQTNRHWVGRDIVLAAPVQGYSPVERAILACVVSFHQGSIQPENDALFGALTPSQQRTALALSALVRVADGFDSSHTQSTTIQGVDRREADGMLHIQARGPHSHADAAQADERADLWRALFGEVTFAGYLTSPGLSSSDSLADANRKVLCYRFDWAGGAAAWRIVAGEQATPERIRRLRVAVHRMRSDVRTFEPGLRAKAMRPVVKGLRALADVLKPVRTYDALLANLGAYAARCDDEARAGLAPLEEYWQAQRAQANREVIAFMTSDDYEDWLDGMQNLFVGKMSDRVARPVKAGEPSHVRHIARSVVYQRVAGVRAYDTLPDAPPVKHLHALRLAIKRTRYVVEALRDVLPAEEAQSLMCVCVAAQDAYGAVHDAHEAARHVLQFAARQGEGRFDGQNHGQRETSHERLPRLALKGVLAYAAAQQKVVQARLTNWRDLLQPFL